MKTRRAKKMYAAWIAGLMVVWGGYPAAQAEEAAEIPPALQELMGTELVNASRKKVSVADLAGKRVGIYFTASWCPPCRTFTPQLIDAYNVWRKDDIPFEIVMVSRDRSVADMFKYMRSARMPWLAVPYDSPYVNVLVERYRVRGIPHLVVIDADGKTLSDKARGDVARWGKNAIERW